MSNTPIKNGKKPLSSKPKTTQLTNDDVFDNPLTIPAEIKAELDAQGLVGRWIDAQKLYQNGGYHNRGWTPYVRKMTPSDTMNTSEFRLGRDPDGVIRRGSLILGVKSQDKVDLHRELLRQKTARISSGVQKEKIKELKQFVKESALDAKVLSGYEDDDTNE